MRLRISLAALLSALILTSCSFRHSFPSDARFAAITPPPVQMRLFTDIEGTFYPDGWRDYVDPTKQWDADSLNAEAERRSQAGDDGFKQLIASQEQRQLTELKSAIITKKRVFIFVHGFNNSQQEAADAFNLIGDAIEFTSDDARVDFFWDGYVEQGIASPAIFWFKAAGASQLAGTHGLRKVLALLQPGQRAVVISHSRGASVVLSALSDPAFSDRFKAEARKLHGWNPGDASSLVDQTLFAPREPRLLADRIDLVMLAPAIGRIDFWKASCPAPDLGMRGDPCADPYREFPKALRSLNYSINPGDPVLKKFVGLSHHFYPTDFGLSPELGKELGEHYKGDHKFQAFWITPTHAHPFACYVTNDDFVPMLKSIDVKTRPLLALPANRRPNCKVKRSL